MATIIKQKETFRVELTLTDAKSNAPINLTDCTAYSQMRSKPGEALIATATCTVNAAKGTIDVLWTADQTADFPLGPCGYDVWLVIYDEVTDRTEQRAIYTDTIQVIKGYTENIGE